MARKCPGKQFPGHFFRREAPHDQRMMSSVDNISGRVSPGHSSSFATSMRPAFGMSCCTVLSVGVLKRLNRLLS
jgi:hypothetical protein